MVSADGRRIVTPDGGGGARATPAIGILRGPLPLRPYPSHSCGQT